MSSAINRVCFVALVILLCSCRFILADFFQGCENRENTYIASDKSCTSYIYCFGDESFEGDCDDDTPYFSETDQTCDTDPAVCKDFNQDGEPNAPEENPVSSSAAPSSTLASTVSSVRPSNSTISTFASTSPTTLSTTLSSTFFTTPSSTPSTTPSTTKTSSTQTTTTTSATVVNSCPSDDDPSNIVFLQDSKACSDYYMCYHGQPLPMHCSPTLHFDINTSKCDYPQNVKCQLDNGSPRDKCQAHTVDVYPHPLNCNYYYMCKFGYLMVMQCPPNMGWDYTVNACVLRSKAKCYTNLEESKK